MVLKQRYKSGSPEQPFQNKNAQIIPNQELQLSDNKDNRSLYLDRVSINYSKCFI